MHTHNLSKDSKTLWTFQIFNDYLGQMSPRRYIIMPWPVVLQFVCLFVCNHKSEAILIRLCQNLCCHYYLWWVQLLAWSDQYFQFNSFVIYGHRSYLPLNKKKYFISLCLTLWHLHFFTIPNHIYTECFMTL